MLNRIRDRFGTAGLIVSIMALVLALAGGAFAASGLNSKQKKQVKAIAKQFAGKPGATGPAGPAGPTGSAGANGKDGTNGRDGTNGTNGTNGQSVTVTDVAAFSNCGDATGYRLVSASGTDFVCNGLDGEDGSPWTAGGTRPVGSTETGSLGDLFRCSRRGLFGLVLSCPIVGRSDTDHVHTATDANFADFDGAGAGTTGCTGSTASPSAPSGHLCVYGTDNLGNLSALGVANPAGGGGASQAGAVLLVSCSNFCTPKGTFAVTG